MKTLKLIVMAIFAFILSSCSKDDDFNKEENHPLNDFYTISFNLGGEISTSEAPLSKAVDNNCIYGLNVYYKEKDNQEWKIYAYGLFDNIGDMNISLFSLYKYKFECTLVKDKENILYYKPVNFSNNGNIIATKEFRQPFCLGPYYDYHYPDDCMVENKFILSNSFFLAYIKNGAVSLKRDPKSTTYKIDRYYGEFENYVPTNNGKVNIDMKRTVFGLKINIKKPSDGEILLSGDYFISKSVKSTDNDYSSESIYTFHNVYNCWKNDNYSEDLNLKLLWQRKNGPIEEYKKTITIKRNVKTTVNINVSSDASSPNSSLGLNLENKSMINESENWNINSSGGTNDTDIKPEY